MATQAIPPQDTEDAGESRERLGAGRSGEVWLVESEGEKYAVKVFAGDTLSNLVHYLLTGAPNPYIWNEDAIRAAYERRKILKPLLQMWLGERLHASDAVCVNWNEEARAWELGTEYVEGDPVPLLHPFRAENPALDTLRDEVLQPLQERLIESGFDGAVWQAGKGNPVGLNNYLCTEACHSADARFGFIDAESGVPALFPLNVLELFRFYLPASWKHGHAMFDDVDVERLRAYLREHTAPLRRELGEEGYAELQERAERLDHHQERWRSQSRAERGIEYQLSKGRLSEERAAYFRRHSWLWTLREWARAAAKFLLLLGVKLPEKIGGWILGIDLRNVFGNLWKFVTSQEYRTLIARRYVRGRVREWRKRGQLEDDHARALLQELRTDDKSTYLTDFGAHLGMKATFQLLEFTLFAVLVATGVLPVWFVPLIIALDGLIYRTAYTLYRMARNAAARRPLPWIALFVGLIPLLGSLAFPVQMVYSAQGRREHVARFVIYDTLTRLGVRLPIWGGKDTLTEHTLNRFAHRLVHRGERERQDPPPPAPPPQGGRGEQRVQHSRAAIDSASPSG